MREDEKRGVRFGEQATEDSYKSYLWHGIFSTALRLQSDLIVTYAPTTTTRGIWMTRDLFCLRVTSSPRTAFLPPTTKSIKRPTGAVSPKTVRGESYVEPGEYDSTWRLKERLENIDICAWVQHLEDMLNKTKRSMWMTNAFKTSARANN